MLAKLTGFFFLGLIRLLTGAQARWYGCPPKAEQRIYFANHQSHADLVMIWAALPQDLRGITRPIAAKDYWTKTPLREWITTAVFNAVYVDRTGGARAPATPPAAGTDAGTGSIPPVSDAHDTAGPQQPLPFTDAAAAAMAPATAEADPPAPLVEALERGDSIIIFPEGTRGFADEPQPFKSGLYTLARRFPQVVLVPAWIQNIQRVMPKGEVVPVPILCSVTFGTPVVLGAGEERRPFLDRARDAVIALRDI